MNGWRQWATAAAGVVILVAGCGGGAGSGRSHGMISAEQRFTLKDLNGEDVSLDQTLASKKAVLVNFWATWCPPCREEIPDLIRLQDKYGDKGFTVLGVDVGESARRVKPFAEKNHMNYPILLDSDNAAAEAYRVVGIPTSLLIDHEGRILGEYHAATPQLFLDVESALNA